MLCPKCHEDKVIYSHYNDYASNKLHMSGQCTNPNCDFKFDEPLDLNNNKITYSQVIDSLEPNKVTDLNSSPTVKSVSIDASAINQPIVMPYTTTIPYSSVITTVDDYDYKKMKSIKNF